MAESVAVMSSVPQRPPPPTRTPSQVGVAKTTQRQNSDNNFRIVDSRAKARETPLKKQSKDLDQSSSLAQSTSSNQHVTVIDSKHSPLLEKKATPPARPSVPPSRPHPPVHQNTIGSTPTHNSTVNQQNAIAKNDSSDKIVGGDACDGGVSSDPSERSSTKRNLSPTRPSFRPPHSQPIITRPRSLTSDVDIGDESESGKGGVFKSPEELGKLSQTRPNPRPPRPRSFTLDRDVFASIPRRRGGSQDSDGQRDSREGSVGLQMKEVATSDTEKLPDKQEEADDKGEPPPRPSRPPPPRPGGAPPRTRAKSLSASTKGRLMRARSPTMDGVIRPPPRENSREVTPPPAVSPPVRPAPLSIPTRPTLPHKPTTPPHKLTTPTHSPQSPTLLSLDPLEKLIEQPDPVSESNTEEDIKPSVSRTSRSVSSPDRTTEATPTLEPRQEPVNRPRSSTDEPSSELTKHTPTPPTSPSHTGGETETNPPPGGAPVIPRRPYLPPRPFPPRPNSANKQGPPPKPTRSKRSPQHPSKRAPKRSSDATEPIRPTKTDPISPRRTSDGIETSVAKKPTTTVKPGTSPPPAPKPTSSLHNFSPVTRDSPKVNPQAALMMSVEEPAFLDSFEYSDEESTPSLSITQNNAVQFGFPSDYKQEASATPPDYNSSLPATLNLSTSMIKEEDKDKTEEISEESDQVTELESSSGRKFGGKKLINSMKKSFRSLRIPRRSDRHTGPQSQRERSNSSFVPGTSKEYPDPLPQGILDPLVVKCVAYLNRESVIVEQGLFRVPGDVAAIKRLRASFVSGVNVDLEEVLDPHTVCGLLKLHFREQRVSLIPRGPTLTELIQHVKQGNVDGVREVFEKIDVIHVSTLRILTELLSRVVAHSDVNKMTAGTLATSCGPSIFPYLPPSNSNQLLKFLVDNTTEVFA